MNKNEKKIIMDSLKVAYVTKNNEYEGIKTIANALIGRQDVKQFEISIDISTVYNDYLYLLNEAKKVGIDCFNMDYMDAIEYIKNEAEYTDNEHNILKICNDISLKILESTRIRKKILNDINRR